MTAILGATIDWHKETMTMEHRTHESNRAKRKIANDVEAATADGEDVLEAATNAPGVYFTAAREKLDETLSSAKAGLADVSRLAVDQARTTAVASEDYLHSNPWTVIGIAAAAGALIGFLAAKRGFLRAMSDSVPNAPGSRRTV